MIYINTYFSQKFSLNLKLVLNNFLRFNKALISNVFKYQISKKKDRHTERIILLKDLKLNFDWI